MKGQSKRASLLESAINILIGYGVAIAAQKAIFPLFGIHISTADNVKVAALFTVVSLVRIFWVRRLFNWWHVSQAQPASPALTGTAIIEDAVARTLGIGKRGFAAPQQLQLMLIEAALRFVGRARRHWAANQEDAACQSLIRSQNILAEMLAVLKRNAEDELTPRVTGVYMFIYRLLVEAGFEHSEKKLIDALWILEIERDTWRMVCDQISARDEDQSTVGRMQFVA